MSTAEVFLSHCRIVQQLRPRKSFAASWRVSCPGHDDKSPSLDVDLTLDGRVLLCCRAGCNVYEIIAGAGLEIHDLFPRRANDRLQDDRTRPKRETFSAADALRLIDSEVDMATRLILVCSKDDLTPNRRTRLAEAAMRIRKARQGAGLRDAPQ